MQGAAAFWAGGLLESLGDLGATPGKAIWEIGKMARALEGEGNIEARRKNRTRSHFARTLYWAETCPKP